MCPYEEQDPRLEFCYAAMHDLGNSASRIRGSASECRVKVRFEAGPKLSVRSPPSCVVL